MDRNGKNISEIIEKHQIKDAYFGHVAYPPGGTHGPLVQSNFQLVVIESAHAVVRVDARRFKVEARHACLLIPGQKVHFQFSKTMRTEHSWCTLQPSHGAVALGTQGRMFEAMDLVEPVGRTLAALMRLGLGCMDLDRPQNARLRVHLGLALFQAWLTPRGNTTSVPLRLPPPVLLAQQFVTAHLGDPIDLKQMAKAAGVTPNHLVRLFRRYLNITPSRYLWKRRTEQGVALLRDTGMNLGEIAYRVGFRTPFHFSRLTRQHHGQSPRQLRKQFWGHEVEQPPQDE